ncbi:RNA 2',3'-cyclic phosphodiesterase [Georgenia sp. MJ206]|uniref:RNA 2',3'-cyclic phosphodiesterase n=1 Tax=Georgenia wangjunii TaxID=3117730 RepID=UPI002F25F649
MRLFVAIRPPAAVLDHLDAATAGFRALVGGGGPPALRWTAPEQRHVTLAFYGDVPDGVLASLAADLADVAAGVPPLRLELAGAGSFTRRTLWAGVRAAGGTDPTALVDLMAACEAAGVGLRGPAAATTHAPRDRRRAHLTLARVSARSRDVDLGAVVHALSVYVGPAWTATEIELVASELGKGRGGGPLHDVLERVPLGGGGHDD